MLVRMTIIKKWWTREMIQELRAHIFSPRILGLIFSTHMAVQNCLQLQLGQI